MKSMKALDRFENDFLDFAYIDGDHAFESCIQDIIKWSYKVRHGGIIAVHDYTNMPGSVGIAVNAYTQAHHIDPWYVTTKEREGTAFWVKP